MSPTSGRLLGLDYERFEDLVGVIETNLAEALYLWARSVEDYAVLKYAPDIRLQAVKVRSIL